MWRGIATLRAVAGSEFPRSPSPGMLAGMRCSFYFTASSADPSVGVAFSATNGEAAEARARVCLSDVTLHER